MSDTPRTPITGAFHCYHGLPRTPTAPGAPVKKPVIAALIGVMAALVAAPLSAQAVDPWPSDDTFTVGDVKWGFDEYGLDYGWDAADNYSSNGYAYYPGFFETDTDYLYCPNYDTTAVVNTLANGDITIDCESTGVIGYAGLENTYHFRLYSTSSNGWLLRVTLDIENTTGADMSINNNKSYFFGTYWGDVADYNYLTSSGETTDIGSEDSWFISGSKDGSTVYQTSAWARTGQTAAEGLSTAGAGGYSYVDYTGITFPANSTTHLVQFVNLVIPTAQDEASSTASFATAQAQVSEFDNFCGRLTEGLDPSVDYLGWGTPTSCAQPALADTGRDTSNLWIVLGGSVVLVVLGAAGVLLARRRSRA
jgi:LPXTG-motif cell wall-anchored protein